MLAHGDDVAGEAEGQPVLPRRRDDHRFVPDAHDGAPPEAHEPARQQPALRPRQGPAGADPRPSPAGLLSGALSALPPAIHHTVLDRRLAPPLGDAALGPRFRADAGGPDRDAVLAAAPLRPCPVHAWFSS